MTDPTRQPSLDRLIARLSSLIGAATDALERDPSRADEWYNEVARQLRRYTNAAYISGQGGGEPARRVVQDYIDTQLKYLAAFRDEIKAADEWQDGWNSRAQMYAESIKASWWAGNTRGWALPAMPGETGQCLTRCRCSWEIVELEGDGNADCYWRLGGAESSCQTCIQRAADWNPLRIRAGELQ